MSDGYLVSGKWLKKVDDAIDAPGVEPIAFGGSSRFYDVRPARITGDEWTETGEDSGVWRASANFLLNEVADETTTITVYSYSTSAPKVDSLVYVVWRGRWEVVSSPSEGLRVGAITAISNDNFRLYQVSSGGDSFECSAPFEPDIYLTVDQRVVFGPSESGGYVIVNAEPL